MPTDLPADVFAADFSAVIERGATAFTWGGGSYSGILTDLKKERPMDGEMGGFVTMYDATLFCLQSAFATLPDIGALFVIGSANYRVEARWLSPDNVEVRFDLKNAKKA